MSMSNRPYLIAMAAMAMGTATLSAQRVATDRERNVLSRDILARRVTVDLRHVTLKDAIQILSTTGDVRMVYQTQTLEAITTPITVKMTNVSLGNALNCVLTGTGLTAELLTSSVISIKRVDKGSEEVAQGDIAGRILDARTGRPLRGGAISVDGTTRGAIAGDDGRFNIIGVAVGKHILHVRLLGYTKTTKDVVVSESETASVEVRLDPSVNALDQVVVIGTVIPTPRKAVPNAMTVVTAQDIEQRGITQIDQLFHGDIPGLFARRQGSLGTQPGAVVMASRGATSFDGALTQPMKTYVDGVELADPSYLGLIDPKSIERIEILAGPQASTIYGSNAINGVMQIFTKRGGVARPQLTLTLQSGLIQNDFSAALTPQHDYAAQVAGVEGHLSYNAGASWVYTGPWTPSVHVATSNGFGGVRFQQGAIVGDASVRRTLGTNWQNGGTVQREVQQHSSGELFLDATAGIATPMTYTSNGQTLSTALTYALAAWWSQTLTVGSDATDIENRVTAARRRFPGDSVLQFSRTMANRTTVSYTTTVRTPLTPIADMVVTAGADGWHRSASMLSASAPSLTGTLAPVSFCCGLPALSVTRQPSHDRGAFLQGQVSLGDKLFVTYGMRAEWNPDYGGDANPNIVPRYGIAFTHEIGAMTAKVRGSYGHATRPPAAGLSAAIPFSPDEVQYYGPGYTQVANPALVPEQQRGGEGGAEFYFGGRGSLIVTRFNQIVDHLIQQVTVDSADLLPVYRALYGCAAWECAATGYSYLNIGSIRNQGWELQGTVTTGPLTMKGTYSWTKSRILGVTEQYRARFKKYAPGAAFALVPEHTYAVQIQYARHGTSLLLDVQGQGLLYLNGPELNYYVFGDLWYATATRLTANNPRVSGLPEGYIGRGPGYSKGDLSVSQRCSSSLDAVLQIQNVTNRYNTDRGPGMAAMGRSTKMGLRVRL